MLLTVIGTQNTGKSTFLNDFIKEFPNWEKPSIDYRGIVLEKGLKLNRNGNLYSQNILFEFTLNDLMKYHGRPQNVILDRSIIDAHVYTRWLYSNRPEMSGVTEKDVQKQMDIINKHVKLYDGIIYIPLCGCGDIKVIDDEFRDTDLDYRKQIDDIFSQTLSEIGIDNVWEIYGTREERIERIKEKLFFR